MKYAGHRRTNTIRSHLCEESKIVRLIAVESKRWLPGPREKENWGDIGQGVQSSSYARWVSSGEPVCSKVTTVDDTVLCS